MSKQIPKRSTAANSQQEEEASTPTATPSRAIATPSKRQKFLNPPNPNTTIAEKELTIQVFRWDETHLHMFIIFDPMGQPDEVVAELNLALRSTNPDEVLIVTNILFSKYKAICVITQGSLYYYIILLIFLILLIFIRPGKPIPRIACFSLW